MANLVRRAKEAEANPQQENLPKYEAQVVVDGSLVHFILDMDKLATMSVEREGKKEDGTVYMKNPGVMVIGKAKDVEVIQRNSEDGLDYLLKVDFQLGSNFGAYGAITKSKIVGLLKPEVNTSAEPDAIQA